MQVLLYKTRLQYENPSKLVIFTHIICYLPKSISCQQQLIARESLNFCKITSQILAAKRGRGLSKLTKQTQKYH